MREASLNWDDVRRMADELELKIHLAGMDARDRWRALQPRLAKLEHSIAHQTERAAAVLADELAVIGKALQKLRDDLSAPKAP